MQTTARLLPVVEGRGAALALTGLDEHLAHHGPLPAIPGPAAGRPGALVDEIQRAGLRGRGGGWFPTARKLHAVVESAAARRALSRGRKPVVIANAMEGEPASSKDAVLLAHAPHLVLDGIQAAALTIGATRAFIAVHRGSPLIPLLDAAIAQRVERRCDAVPLELVTPPARYVASEESALTHWIDADLATPVFGSRPFQRGVDGRPTLVQNAETLAHIALIARHGGEWFASVGDPQAPGTALVSVGGAVGMPGVIEVATGTPVRDVLARCAGPADGVIGYLTGGYGGAWVASGAIESAHWSPESLREIGGVIGAGVLWALDPRACPIAELSRVADYLAGESAGQCGPCRFGLPAVADDLVLLHNRELGDADLARLDERLARIVGRGGCKLPDGAVRFVETGLRTFALDVAHHRHGTCTASSTSPVLPVPEVRPSPVPRPGRDLR